jgi:hypothetical protein
MKMKLALGLALSLACISAAESPSNYRTYEGRPVEGDPVLLSLYARVLDKCAWEARTPPRGTVRTDSLHYNAALRSCLYRQGFLDRGTYAYPATLLFDHFLDR